MPHQYADVPVRGHPPSNQLGARGGSLMPGIDRKARPAMRVDA